MEKPILIIEDNEQNLYMMTFLLEKHGYQVSQACNGIEGIELAKQVNPALILLDIQLPGMDGYAVARGLKDSKALADISIVAVTSYAMVGDREKAMASGCDGYIEKPIDPESFIHQIRKYLKVEKISREIK